MSQIDLKKLLTKTVNLYGKSITLYSVDGDTWSSDPNEPGRIQERQEEGRVILQDRMHGTNRSQPAAITVKLARLPVEDDLPIEDELDEVPKDDEDLDLDEDLALLDDGDDEIETSLSKKKVTNKPATKEAAIKNSLKSNNNKSVNSNLSKSLPSKITKDKPLTKPKVSVQQTKVNSTANNSLSKAKSTPKKTDPKPKDIKSAPKNSLNSAKKGTTSNIIKDKPLKAKTPSAASKIGDKKQTAKDSVRSPKVKKDKPVVTKDNLVKAKTVQTTKKKSSSKSVKK